MVKQEVELSAVCSTEQLQGKLAHIAVYYNGLPGVQVEAISKFANSATLAKYVCVLICINNY